MGLDLKISVSIRGKQVMHALTSFCTACSYSPATAPITLALETLNVCHLNNHLHPLLSPLTSVLGFLLPIPITLPVHLAHFL